MGKVAQSSVKYVINAELKSGGVIEKPDVVGAVFGQTEGLLGEELDLRELQERGRIGRIEVKVEKENRKSKASIQIPTSLDATETCLLAASLETIERVGPTNADIRVKKIEDQRTSKRDYIVKRAKQLLEQIETDKPEKREITQEIREQARTSEVTSYNGFEAGPSAETSKEIVLVEGRADLVNLLRNGVKNVLVLGGTSIPEKIFETVEEKEVTLFLDGDRGGDLILKEFLDEEEPDYVARAPENKEVEELTKEQIHKSLRDKEPFEYVKVREVEKEIEKPEELLEQLNNLLGTRAVHTVNEELETIDRFPLNRFEEKAESLSQCYAVIIDGEIDRDKVEKLEQTTEYVIGMDKTGRVNSSETTILTKEDLKPVTT